MDKTQLYIYFPINHVVDINYINYKDNMWPK